MTDAAHTKAPPTLCKCHKIFESAHRRRLVLVVDVLKVDFVIHKHGTKLYPVDRAIGFLNV